MEEEKNEPGVEPYIKIPLTVFEALMKTRIHAEPRKILDCIMRKTYGWSKKSDKIPLLQFEEATEMKRNNICRAIKKLEKANIIIVNRQGYISEYKVNENTDNWITTKKKPKSSLQRETSLMRDVSNERINSLQRENEVVSNERHSKNTLSNDISSKNKEHVCSPSKNDYSEEFEEWWQAYHPKRRSKNNKYEEVYPLYGAHRKNGTGKEQLLDAVKNYMWLCEEEKTELRYILHPTSFLSKKTKKFKAYIDTDKVKAMISKPKCAVSARQDMRNWKYNEGEQEL